MGPIISNKKKEKSITIKIDRLETYKDFLINMTNNLFKYYVEDSFDDEDEKNFHRWCFNKTNDEFKKEGIDFGSNEKLEKYLFGYYKTNFFDFPEKKITDIITFWDQLFEVSNLSNKNLFNIMVELYLLFNISIDLENIE